MGNIVHFVSLRCSCFYFYVILDCYGILRGRFRFGYNASPQEDPPRTGDSGGAKGRLTRLVLLAFSTKDSSRCQGREHSTEWCRPGQTGRLWRRWTAYCNFTYFSLDVKFLHKLCQMQAGYNGQKEHCNWDAILDGTRSDPGMFPDILYLLPRKILNFFILQSTRKSVTIVKRTYGRLE